MKRKAQENPTPQMPNPEALGLGIDGKPRGSVDGPKGTDILGPNDIDGIQTFVGRRMVGDFRQQDRPPAQRKRSR
jgi:hypothetical protein